MSIPGLARRAGELAKQNGCDVVVGYSHGASDAVRVSGAYLDYIAADQDPAARLAASGNPAWLVHAEKGDGGLTDAERATLEAAANVTLVKIPGAVFLLPDEAPQQTAEVIASAVAQAT